MSPSKDRLPVEWTGPDPMLCDFSGFRVKIFNIILAYATYYLVLLILK